VLLESGFCLVLALDLVFITLNLVFGKPHLRLQLLDLLVGTNLRLLLCQQVCMSRLENYVRGGGHQRPRLRWSRYKEVVINDRD
jgi:hypothetical protein